MTPKKFDIPDIPDIPGIDEPGKGGGRGRKKGGGGGRRRRWPWFVAGLVLGALGTIFLPGLLRPYLPAALRGNTTRVPGLVVAKGKEGTKLLLTVDTPQGAMLATFQERVPEIDLLVARGDSVTLGVASYRPFIEEPALLSVRKPSEGWGATSGGAPAGAPAGSTGAARAGSAGSVPSGRDTTPSGDTLRPDSSGPGATGPGPLER